MVVVYLTAQAELAARRPAGAVSQSAGIYNPARQYPCVQHGAHDSRTLLLSPRKAGNIRTSASSGNNTL